MSLSFSEMLGAYERCKQVISSGQETALLTTLAFSTLAHDTFDPVPKVRVRSDYIGQAGYHDAFAYYSMVTELYYKVNLLLLAAGYVDSGKHTYTRIEDALRTTWEELCNTSNNATIVNAYASVVAMFMNYSPLLISRRIIPTPELYGGFQSLTSILEYTLRSADTLFYLVCHNNAETYMKSNYALPSLVNTAAVVDGLGQMLSSYYATLEAAVENGC